VTVVFGRVDGATVDTRELGTQGFDVLGAGRSSGGGFSGVMLNSGVAPLGDVSGDGVPDLLVSSGGGASVVFPPADPRGASIDARTAGPNVATIRVAEEQALDDAQVDVLGDVDGDGRADVLLGGEERTGTDQVAFGVRTPAPGAQVVLPRAVDDGTAFEVRTHDGRDGWHGELEQVRTIGDQDGDGVRDVALLCGGCGTGGRQLRTVFSPPFGTRVDAGSLHAADGRGWSFHSYADVIDVGDQDGDGDGDVGTRSYVFLPDPANEPGTREPVHDGFYFEGGGEIAASLADVNGDGRREIALATVELRDVGTQGGQHATYRVDVHDSARAPEVGLPDVPTLSPDGLLEVGVDVLSGAGSRGDGVPVLPQLELAGTSSGTQLAPAQPTASGSLRLAMQPAGLVRGQQYALRVSARNGRGQHAAGPWRTFVAGAPGARGPSGRRAPAIMLGRARLRAGRLLVPLTCTRGRPCTTTLRAAVGRRALGARREADAAGSSRELALRVPATTRRWLARAARRTLTLTATGTSAQRVVQRLRTR
jgi:hypothetical protein